MINDKQLSEMEARWSKWLIDNITADVQQRYYAAGVLAGIKFALQGESFTPDWNSKLGIHNE